MRDRAARTRPERRMRRADRPPIPCRLGRDPARPDRVPRRRGRSRCARIEADLAALAPALHDLRDPALCARACARLAERAAARAGPASRALLRFLAELARTERTLPGSWIGLLLAAADPAVRLGRGRPLLEQAETGTLVPDRELVRHVAREVETEGSTLRSAQN